MSEKLMNDYAMDSMLAAMQNKRLVEENEALRRENDRLWEMLSVPEVRQALLNSLALRQEV